MKKTHIIFVLLYVVSSTLSAKELEGLNPVKEQHRCISSAGYQWSTLKKECIRPFELKIQLSNPEKTFNCGIILSKNKNQAEVFSKEGNFILVKEKRKTIYQSPQQTWILIKVEGKWKIKDGKGKVIYLS